MFYNIQGLRAIAVISVILFHYQIEYFDGGFLGVDIFFVISGYLMTLILDKKINYKTILEFYFKRIKTIPPALLFVVFISLILGFLLISENSFERIGKTTLSSIFFVSNFYFWREWGYFDLYSLNKPLLHTWSLSLEMQFYLIFPILLLFINFFFKKINIIYKLIILFFLFILFTELLINEKKIASFYLLPFRICEFLMGSIGYYYEKNYKIFNIQKNYIFIISFSLLVFFILSYDKNIKFPGLNAFLPCLITLFLILNKESYLSKKILQNKILLFIGNISYSLFLIHWPLFVYYRFYKFNEPSNFEKFLLIIVSIILAYLLNKYVENYLKKNISIKNNYKFIFSFLIVSTLSLLVIFNNGYEFRIKKTNNLNVKLDNKEKNIFKDRDKKEFFYKKCIINSESKKLDFILLGDSHAFMYAQAFLNYSKKYKKNFCIVDLLVSCNFFKDYKKGEDFKKNNCSERQKLVIDDLSQEKFSTLIISYAWLIFNYQDLDKIKIKYENFYEKTFKNKEKNILFLLSVPEFSNGITMEKCAEFPKYIIKNRNCHSASREALIIKKNHFINERIQAEINKSQMGNTFFLNPYDFLCGTTKCKQVINGYDVYTDKDHLSIYASKLMIDYWKNKLTSYIK